MRYFHGNIGAKAAVLDIRSRYRIEGHGWDDRDWDGNNWGDRGSERSASIELKITNVSAQPVLVDVLDAYTGNQGSRVLRPNDTSEGEQSLGEFHNWYDLIVTVDEDPAFKYHLAGHVETGRNSFSDPALGNI